MPCIILTAYPSVHILNVVNAPLALRYLEKKPPIRQPLLDMVEELFEEKLRINFDLADDYQNSFDLINRLVHTVRWVEKPAPTPLRLILQVFDLLGKLFYRARRIHIVSLKPGLSGAAVILVRPTWDYGPGPAYVVKISRRSKIKIEQHNYDEYVRRYLPLNVTTQVNTVYTQHLGAIQYSFAEDEGGPLKEFDELYRSCSVDQIIQCLENVIFTTCVHWYDAKRPVVDNLSYLYFNALNLSQERLEQVFAELLPGYAPHHETIWLERYQREIVNPLYWLEQHRDTCVLEIYQSITHGDMTGRNIMTRDCGKCWLIDFYRTYESHILRDFVILETDIKYRLLNQVTPAEFMDMENALLHATLAPDDIISDESLTSDALKATRAIIALRESARRVSNRLGAKDHEFSREYLIALLMTTLNVVRLRHISGIRKQDALYSAGLLCGHLNVN